MRGWLGVALCLAAPGVRAADVIASPPSALSVTIYRAPYRNGGAIDLKALGGFALVKETRLVHLPAGESRLRFEGVVDGIQPASAILSGLPGGVIEKNRDAAVLSPEALIRAAMGAQVTLVRTERKTGRTLRIPATIRSANAEGVIFQTEDGVEALKCSGVPETFAFSRVPAGLSATPTLSVLTRSAHETTARVTLSYLAANFDWAANYVAKLAPDGRTLALSGWITLANGNGVSLPAARVQIVAGKLNRVTGDEDISMAAPEVIARCWPEGTTSDPTVAGALDAAHPYAPMIRVEKSMPMSARFMPPPMPAPAPPPPPPPEQLGDLKLYRLAERTTVAARESKQVRLLDQADVSVTRLAVADLAAFGDQPPRPATRILRTRNDLADKLGLPLPAGVVAVFSGAGDHEGLVGEAPVRDLAVGEDVDLKLGETADIQVRQTSLTVGPTTAHHRTTETVEITNAGDAAEPFELRLSTHRLTQVVESDPPMALKDGRPIFRLIVPPHGALTVHYTVAEQ